MPEITLHLRVRYPWWWRLYLWALIVFEYTVGGVDSDVAAEFLARHMRCEAVNEDDRDGAR